MRWKKLLLGSVGRLGASHRELLPVLQLRGRQPLAMLSMHWH
jgi:hypothetical protein